MIDQEGLDGLVERANELSCRSTHNASGYDMRCAFHEAQSMLDDLAQAITSLRAQITGYQYHLRECEQIAGRALGYPWFKDDPANFPDCTEADGVCVGEHIGDTIVEELANRYTSLRGEVERLNASQSQPILPSNGQPEAETSAALGALELVAALRGADHKRGCEGRNYVCTCGFDGVVENTIMLAALALRAAPARSTGDSDKVPGRTNETSSIITHDAEGGGA